MTARKTLKNARLGILFAVVLIVLTTVLALLAFRSSADPEPVARVGSETYTTLGAACDAVAANGTVKLLSDVTASGINVLKNMTLDLNGHSLTVGSGGINVVNSEFTVDNSVPATGGVKGEGIGYSGTSKIIFRHCRTTYSYDSLDMLVNYADYEIADGFLLEALADDPNGFKSIVRPEHDEIFTADAYYIDKYGYPRVRASGNYTLLTSGTTSLDSDTWFVVFGQVETTNTLTLNTGNATINIILMDGAELTMKNGAYLRISGGSTVNIYKGGTDEYSIEGTGIFKIDVGYTCSVMAVAGDVNLNVYGGTFIANNTYDAFTSTVVLTAGEDLTVYAGDNEASAVKVTGDGWKNKAYVRVTKAPTHTHDAITFEEWESANSLPTVAGNYYLTQDVTFTGTWNAPSGETNLCLNGHSIRKQNEFTRLVVGSGNTLNLYDCDDTVKYVSFNGDYLITAVSDTAPEGVEWEDYIVVTGGFIYNQNAQGIYVDGSGTFNMYGGTICLSSRCVEVFNDAGTFNLYGGTICASHDGAGVKSVGTVNIAGGVIEHNVNPMLGGGIFAERGTVTVSGGVIRNNRTDGVYYSGGGIYVTSAGVLNISGGEIRGNEAGRDGGGVYCDGELTLTGGSITGNHAGENGGGIVLPATNHISGNPVVQNNTAGDGNAANNVYTGTNKLAVDAPLTDGAYLSVTMQTPGVFTEGLDGNLPGGKTVEQVFFSDTMRYGVSLDGTEATLIQQHGHDETAFTTAWDSADSLPDAAGSYYLTQNVVLGSWTVPEGTVNLCLNGYGIKLTGGKITVGANSTLNLYDCNESNTTYYIVPDANGRVSSISNSTSEGAVAVSGGYIANAPQWAISVEGGNFNLYGGTICFNCGGVKLTAGSIEMNGGAISYNNTTSYNPQAGLGSGVYVDSVTFTMNGGTISHNKNNSFGGGVYIGTGGTFILNDGYITDNKAYAGGGVSNFGGTFTMNGGEISSNTSDELGGGVEVEGGTSFTMTGGVISGNTSGMGAGISSGGVFTLTGGSIINNTASFIGGGIVIKSGEFHISGAPVVKDNVKANDAPSNVCIWNMDHPNYVTVDGALTGETPYGVDMYTPDVFTVDGVAAYKDNFTSDDPTYVVKTTAEGALTLALAHVHSFTYTVSGATITATCANDECSLPENKATLTLVGPTGSLVYDGNPRSATIEAGYDTEAFPSATIVYYKNNAVVDACIGAGSYVATVTFGDATAEVPFTIAKATPDYTVPTGLVATYGDTLSGVTLPTGWTWVEAGTTAVGNAGNRDHQALFTPADTANYETVTETVTIAVAKAIPAYVVPTGLSAVFNKTLANVALPTGWTWDAPSTGVGSEAGDKVFKATFTPEDTDNYEIVSNVDVTVNVYEHQHVFTYELIDNGTAIKASCYSDECPYEYYYSTLTVAAPENLVYDGNDKWPTVTYTPELFDPVEIKYFVGEQEVNHVKNVGTYVVKVTSHGVTAQIEFTVTASSFADYNLTLSTDTLTYTGEEQSVAATVLHKNGGTPLQEGTAYTLSGQKATEVGEYTLTITGIGNFSGTVSATYHVVPANIEGLGIDAPEGGFDDNYIYAVTPWTTTNIHYWGDTNGGEYVTWPGAQMESLGNGLFRYPYPTLKNDDTAVFLIFDTDGGSEQTADLKDSKAVALGSVYFVTAKEPGQSHAATIFKSRDQQRAVVTLAANSADLTSVVFAGKTLTVDVDYTVSYKTSGGSAIEKPILPGDYIVVVTGKGNYTGSVEKAFTLTHDHSFTYTVNGATITATCSVAGCPLQDGKSTLTLVAPAGELVYDGNAKSATVAEGYSTDAFPSVMIVYEKGGATVESCVGAGSYVAKVTVDSVTAEVPFTIAKATPTYAVPTGIEATYGDTLSGVTLPTGWTWVEAGTTAVGNAGTREHQAIYTPEDTDNYETATETVTVTVAKATPEYTLPEGLTSLVDRTLADVTLPVGWTWNDPETNVGSEEGEKTFPATFTPEDTENYEIAENVDVTVRVSRHQHAFTYTADGTTITATCGNPDCYLTEGLTLTLSAPTGETVYDGNARVATVADGYSTEAFPNVEILYYKDNAQVESCVSVGSYVAKVTFGDATVSVPFEITAWTLDDPETRDVTVSIDDVETSEDIQIKVEVKAELSTEEAQGDYTDAVKEKIAENESVAIVYDVKLLRMTIVDGVETLEEIQPDDIKPGAKLNISMKIPEALKGKAFRILHVHNAGDVTEVEYEISADGEYINVVTDRLSEFAFLVTEEEAANAGKHGFCVGWIVMIFAILAAICLAVFLILHLFEKGIYGIVGLSAAGAVWVFALIALIVHTCTVSVIAFILATLILIAFLFFFFKKKKDGEKKEEPKNVPNEKSDAAKDDESAEAEATAVAAAAAAAGTEEEEEANAEEDADAVASGAGVGLRESLDIAAHTTRTEKLSKNYIADYLKGTYPDNVELNERENATSTGLPLADTHYVTGKNGKKTCFVYVYETEGAMMLLLKTKDPLGKEMKKEHESVRRSAFPKAKDAWYSVVVDDSLSNAQVEDMLDRTIALYSGEPIPEKAPAEGIGLKESLDIAAHAHRIEELSKSAIATYLRKAYPDTVELNERVNATTTGLPLADTHYVTASDGKKLCFVYVYETEGAMMLLLKTKDPLGKEFKREHGSIVRRSAFPKAKDAWYSVVVDDSLSNEQVEDMIDRTIALYTGEPAPKKTKHIVAPIHTVAHVTVAEAKAMVTDEQAEDAIEEAVTEHTGKKGIINVDTLSNAFDEGDTVTVEKLKEKKLIQPSVGQVKLLARGTLNKVLHVELQDFSLEAVKMVIATGGTVKRV